MWVRHENLLCGDLGDRVRVLNSCFRRERVKVNQKLSALLSWKLLCSLKCIAFEDRHHAWSHMGFKKGYWDEMFTDENGWHSSAKSTFKPTGAFLLSISNGASPSGSQTLWLLFFFLLSLCHWQSISLSWVQEGAKAHKQIDFSF